MSFDASFEKAERSRVGVQIALWNESLSWLGPLREYARISNAIRGALMPSGGVTASGDTSERRLQFLGWEITTLIATHRSRFPSALGLLNEIFFGQLGFQIGEVNPAVFETTLARRSGPSTLLAILYAWVCESVANAYGDKSDFRRVDLVTSTPTEVVRVTPKNDVGAVTLVNLRRRGELVSENEWSQWCVRPADQRSDGQIDGFKRLTWVQGLVRSLTELFRLIEKTQTPSLDLLSAQLFVLDQIISLQPSETSRWAERAMINTRRGDRSSALDDLKRFFAFHERDSAPPAIVSLFDELRRPN